MASASGLKNKDKVRVAVIEKVNLDTPNDPNDPRHFDIPLSAHTGFPYVKTRAGALQGPCMPNQIFEKQRNYFVLGTVSLLLALYGKKVK